MSDFSSILALVDKHLPKREPVRIGLAPERVRELLATPSWERTRRAAAVSALGRKPKGRWAGERLPAHVVQAMYADYQRLGSCRKVAPLYGRSYEAIEMVFHRRGLPLNERRVAASMIYCDVTYHRNAEGLYRKTTMVGGKRVLAFLHRRMWEDLNGAIPAGHQVTFRDGNNAHVVPANLVCLPKADVTRLHRRLRLSLSATQP